MRVLVTGATGYVGSWTAKAAQDAGHAVRLMVRSPKKVGATAGAIGLRDPEIVVGDVTDEDSVRRALRGCDGLIHTAAAVAVGPGMEHQLRTTNVSGTQQVLDLALAEGVSSIVHVSSAAVLWHPEEPILHPALEPGGASDAYSESKTVAESYARSLQGQGAPLAITYPTAVIGPASGAHLGEAGAGIGKMLRLRMVPGNGAEFAMVDVRDLAAAHVALLSGVGHGKRYVVGGEHLTGRQLAHILTELSHRKVFHLPVPDPLLIGFGAFADRYRRHMPRLLDPFTAASMRFLTHAPAPDNSNAERDLGICFRPARETLAAVVAALR